MPGVAWIVHDDGGGAKEVHDAGIFPEQRNFNRGAPVDVVATGRERRVA